MCLPGAALVGTIWLYAPPGHRRWLQVGSLLLCPASSITVIAGQNAFLTAALLVGGLRLLRRRPLLAGGLVGRATLEPPPLPVVQVGRPCPRQARAAAR